MASDSFTEVTRQSWGGRLRGSLRGIFVGLIFALVAVVLLFTNEGRAVRRARALEEGGGAVVSVSAERVDPANEGRLIHLSGPAETAETLEDPTFGVTARALHLRRKVEMYQWKEKRESHTKKKVGGGTETHTTYSYDKVWSDEPIDSDRFQRSDGHVNPGSFPYPSRAVSASNVRVGAFRLSPSLLDHLDDYQPLEVASLEGVPAEIRARTRLVGGGLYVGADPGSPAVGDLRIRFEQVPPLNVSLVAQQTGDSFSSYRTRSGGEIELLRPGILSAEAMFAAEKRSNRILTWALRAGGFFLLFLGFALVLKPLSVAADVLPFLGNLVGAGTGLVAFLLAALTAPVVISVAWVFYRPVIGVSVLSVGVLAALWLIGRARKAKRATGPPGPPAFVPPPPPPAA